MRAYNFCAGPAALPTAVLEKAQQELLDWQGKGLSIMEMSHRSADYVAVAEKAEADLRKLMNIPENYKNLMITFFENNMENSDEVCVDYIYKFISYMNKLDDIRGTNWKKTFTDISNLLKHLCNLYFYLFYLFALHYYHNVSVFQVF